MSDAIARRCPMTLPPSEALVPSCVLEEGHDPPCRFRLRPREPESATWANRTLEPERGNTLTPIAGVIDVEVDLGPHAPAQYEARIDAHSIAYCVLRMVDNPLDAHAWAGELEEQIGKALCRARGIPCR